VESIASQIAVNLLLSSPNYAVFFVGVVVCLRRWDAHPKASSALLCALLALTAASVLANVGIPAGWQIVLMRGGTPAEAMTVSTVVRIVVSIPYAIGFALMLYAVFAERNDESAEQAAR
jgi:hypothetical protein